MAKSEPIATRDGSEPGRGGVVAHALIAGVEVRALETHVALRACVDLQRETWGADFTDIVPASILKVSQEVGGVAAGAFDGGQLIGFVFGLTGVRDGRLAHWSHMLAVREAYRDQGIGRRLKEFQRNRLRGLGVGVLHWTFDPLVARNAHFNLNRLGVTLDAYTPDLYGETGSPLHMLGTDRVIVTWETGAEGRESKARPRTVGGAPSAQPAVNTSASGQPLADGTRALDVTVRIEIPRDIDAVAEDSIEHARAWRISTRNAFRWYLERGYRVTGFDRGHDDRCFYTLGRIDP